MFCDRCGVELQPGQRFCGSCGKPVGVAVAPPAAESRVARHVQLLAILWLVASVLNLIGALAILLVANTIFGRLMRIHEAWMYQGWLHGLLSGVGVLVLVKAMAGFIAGWGLLERQPWGRVLALILGFVSLLNIPLGTALGIYTLWVLLPQHADEEYRRLSGAA